MKKFFIMLVAIYLISNTVSAQFEKGGWITSLQGSFGAAGRKSDLYKYHNLQIKPELLKLLRHNLAVGFVAGIEQSASRMKNYPGGGEQIQSDLHFQTGPVVRKYFGNLKLRPYAELSVGVKFSRYYSKYSGEAGSSFSNTEAFIRPALGLSYMVNDKVSFNISAGTDLMQPRYRELEINLGISVKLGK